MLSLASIAEEYSAPGTQVTLVWGEEGGGEKSAPWLERHSQTLVRGTVAPVLISESAQKYRGILK